MHAPINTHYGWEYFIFLPGTIYVPALIPSARSQISIGIIQAEIQEAAVIAIFKRNCIVKITNYH